MENFDILEQVTALVDGELKDEEKKRKLETLIKESKELELEYKVQSIAKSTLRSKIKVNDTPSYLKENVIKGIINEIPRINVEEKKPTYGYIFKPAFALAFLAFIVSLLYFLSGGAPEAQELAAQQSGANNMYVQALSNFQSIIDGKLQPQITSDNPSDIKEFFNKHGVKYSTIIPDFENWSLVGGVVSNTEGDNLAHHVYKNKQNKLLYFYQADINCFKENGSLQLSNDMLKMLKKGRFYKNKLNGKNILLWKDNGLICAAVTNDNIASIEHKLISQNN